MIYNILYYVFGDSYLAVWVFLLMVLSIGHVLGWAALVFVLKNFFFYKPNPDYVKIRKCKHEIVITRKCKFCGYVPKKKKVK